MKENTISVENVVIAFNAPDPYKDISEGKILQVFNMKGELIAVDPTTLINELAEAKKQNDFMQDQCNRLEEKNREFQTIIAKERSLKTDLLYKTCTHLFNTMKLARRAVRRFAVKREHTEIAEANTFLNEIMNTSSKYS